MKVIFLDIDGVLNCKNSKSSCYGLMGIDNKKVELLKSIIDKSNAKIVLISSWRTGWEKIHKGQQNYMADYLDRKLKRYGLCITDKTDDYIAMRGEAVIKWLDGKNIEAYAIIDDEIWDYENCGLTGRLVKTDFSDDNGGLNESKVNEVIKILCQERS